MSPTNQAAWLRIPKARLTVDSAPFPQPKPNEIVIKTAAVAINPVDWKIQDDPGFRNIIAASRYPVILGEDVAGEVVEIGSEVKDFKVGQRVIANPPGLASSDPTHSAFQLYVNVPAICAAVLPSGISYTKGVVLPLAISTAAAGLYIPGFLGLPLPPVTSESSPKKDTLLVWGGASSVGSATIQLALSSGVQVFTTASRKNFEFVKSLGVKLEHIFDYTGPDVVKSIVAALKERQSKLIGVYDAIGSNETVKSSVEIVKATEEKGAVVTVLDPPAGVTLPDGIEVKPFHAFSIFLRHPEIGKAVWRYVPEALENGRLKANPEPFVLGKGLDKIQGGLDHLKAGVSAQKVVVEL